MKSQIITSANLTEPFDIKNIHWLDITDPNKKDLEQVAKTYNLHPTSVKDCLNASHLPKFEKIDNLIFAIVRAYDEKSHPDADSVQDLTRKVALFVGETFIISVHRKDHPLRAELRTSWAEKGLSRPEQLYHLLSDLLLACVQSYEKPSVDASDTLDQIETNTFISTSSKFTLEEGYYLKRKVSIIRRMLKQTSEIVEKMNPPPQHPSMPWFRNVKETCDQLYFSSDELLENIGSFLNLQISLQSHRTNEIVRVLTVFSVLFMPLNLIVGIYGMNFEYMPFLHHPLGFIGVMVSMTIIGGGIVYWFHKKGYLKI